MFCYRKFKKLLVNTCILLIQKPLQQLTVFTAVSKRGSHALQFSLLSSYFIVITQLQRIHLWQILSKKKGNNNSLGQCFSSAYLMPNFPFWKSFRPWIQFLFIVGALGKFRFFFLLCSLFLWLTKMFDSSSSYYTCKYDRKGWKKKQLNAGVFLSALYCIHADRKSRAFSDV